MGADGSSQLLYIGIEKFGVGYSADIVLAEDGGLEHYAEYNA
jgi:hypothetical protein